MLVHLQSEHGTAVTAKTENLAKPSRPLELVRDYVTWQPTGKACTVTHTRTHTVLWTDSQEWFWQDKLDNRLHPERPLTEKGN